MATERAVPNGTDWVELAPHHVARYLLAATMTPGKRVLDAGCGAGYGAALMRASSVGRAERVVAVDIDEAILRAAQKQFGAVEFVADDCQTLARAGGPFDLICSFENIEHLARPEDFLAAAAGKLAPDGMLLVSTPDRANTPPFKDGRPANPFHLMEWYGPEFAELLGRHFSGVEMRMQVESHAHAARLAAVEALRQSLFWSNPMQAFLWRKLGRMGGTRRSWKVLEALAAPALADYPIVDAELASIWGKSFCHVAICRGPRI